MICPLLGILAAVDTFRATLSLCVFEAGAEKKRREDGFVRLFQTGSQTGIHKLFFPKKFLNLYVDFGSLCLHRERGQYHHVR